MAPNEESDDEDLRYAIALSLNQQAGAEERDKVSSVAQSGSGNSAFTLLSLNRKKMEEERLSRRAAKVRRPIDEDDDHVEMPASKRRMKAPTSPPVQDTGIPYPDGIVKRTWARGFARTEDDIKIEEVLQKDKLLLALLSSFQWDESWLLEKIDVSRTKVLLAAFAASDSQKESMCENAPRNVKFCFPPMCGPGSMHSKLQILKFPSYLRVVIPTGNLVPYDWGETGMMENMVFLIDLPLLQPDRESRETTLFQTHLQQYLGAMGVDDGMVSSLSKYDFSKTADLGFVYSIPGGHTGGSLSSVGFAGLGTTIKALGLASDEPVEVDFACSSLGAIKYDFIKSIYTACQGTVEKKLQEMNRGAKVCNEPDDVRELQQHFRIYFPSHNTVISSLGGKHGAGTICFQEKWWNNLTFPKELMCDCVNTRDGLLMHSKLILVRQKGTTAAAAAGKKRAAWAYVGSANLSESAWGRVVRDKPSGHQKIVCRNWECGIVLPVRTAPGQDPPVGMDIFRGTVPIPMQVPGRHYSREERPWFY